MSLEMAHKVILPPKKNYIPQFLKQRDINSYCISWIATEQLVADQVILHILYSFRFLWMAHALSLRQCQHYVTWVNYLMNAYSLVITRETRQGNLGV
jgi:hypothetical protein